MQVTGARFAFGEAVAAQESAPVEPPPGRTAYFLVKLAGPPAPEWMRELAEAGADVHGALRGFTLLVGALPERIESVRSRPWVEEVTPFRPVMKVSPKLRRGARRELDARALAAPPPPTSRTATRGWSRSRSSPARAPTRPSIASRARAG
ncbi:hypothetical protein GCM10029992_55530 [Glycomyces albus]